MSAENEVRQGHKYARYSRMLGRLSPERVKATFEKYALPFHARTWEHYLRGDSLPSAVTAVLLDQELAMSLEEQLGAIEQDSEQVARCSGRGRCGCRSVRQKVSMPSRFTPASFARLLRDRREKLNLVPLQVAMTRFPRWWPHTVFVDPLRLWRWEVARSLPNVLFLAGLRHAYALTVADIRVALLQDVANMTMTAG